MPGIDDVDGLEIFDQDEAGPQGPKGDKGDKGDTGYPPDGIDIVLTKVGKEKHTLTFENGILTSAVLEE